MDRLKILFITRDRSQQMEKNSYYLAAELKKQCDFMMWTSEGHISSILSQLPYKPDFILLNDMLDSRLCPFIYGLRDVSIPKGIIFHDISYKIPLRKQLVIKEKIDYIFPHYRDTFIKWFPSLVDKMIWFPHHVNSNIFKDYKLKKNIQFLMIGATIRRFYPLRNYMARIMQKRPGFSYYPHPGYCRTQEIKPGSLIGKEYAMTINRAKIFLTCNSIYNYPVMKYFEIPACNTLLLAPLSKEILDLGFVDGVNCVNINASNFMKKANYFMEFEQERNRIAQNGYNLIIKRHTTSIRVQQLLAKIKEII